MIIAFFFVLIGLLGLWIAGELVVRYSLQLAYLANISTIFIGFILLSISTGLPELSVVFNATWEGIPSLAAGDIMGSNFFDLAIGIGLPVLFLPAITLQKEDIARTIYLIISTALLLLFIFAHNELKLWHGITLLMMYGIINVLSIKIRKENNSHNKKLQHAGKTIEREWILKSPMGTGCKLICSIIGVLISANITVHYAIQFAQFLGLPISHFGATLVALGTSLPELTLSFTAIKNKEYALALGNAFGSLWTQGGFMLGLLTIMNKEPINIRPIWHLLPFALIACGIVAFSLLRNQRIGKKTGLLLVGTYIIFIAFEMIGLYR